MVDVDPKGHLVHYAIHEVSTPIFSPLLHLTTGSTPLYSDNRSVILIAGNPIFHERTKHFEVALHFVRSHYLVGTLSLPHLASVEQTADFFTKAHTIFRFQYLLIKLLVQDPP